MPGFMPGIFIWGERLPRKENGRDDARPFTSICLDAA
jgi:hypothetical protein